MITVEQACHIRYKDGNRQFGRCKVVTELTDIGNPDR